MDGFFEFEHKHIGEGLSFTVRSLVYQVTESHHFVKDKVQNFLVHGKLSRAEHR